MSRHLIIDSNLRELLTELKYVGELRVGQKPNYNSMTISNNGSIIDYIFRRFNRETCDSTAEYISNLCDRTEAVLHDYRNDTVLQNIILQHLEIFWNGLNNLLKTYSNIARIKARYEVLLQNINLIFERYNYSRTEHQPYIIKKSSRKELSPSPQLYRSQSYPILSNNSVPKSKHPESFPNNSLVSVLGART